jgi:hypothetical protein
MKGSLMDNILEPFQLAEKKSAGGPRYKGLSNAHYKSTSEQTHDTHETHKDDSDLHAIILR